ncbi:pyocin S6 family toxin immunity protein [Pseudomonas psychrophila]|uniref:pyocin S6 family toxin immunity protein n=1 Tax=Pseudomonas psychrophila TaxID=122355 RepID=UPI00031F05D2|nr:pyocin S6 family toxin immunity protein [Pseudomonas psychrophila]
MHLCISGFLLESSEDDSLKFEHDLDSSLNDQIVQILGHKNLNAMAEGEWLLTDEQIAHLSEITGVALPTDLKLFIGVEA